MDKKTKQIIVILFIFSLLFRFPALDKPAVTMDEHWWFGYGMDRFGEFDPQSPVWDKEPRMRIDNPPLAEYYMGGWALLGQSVFGASSYSEFLYWARIGNIILGSLLVILIYLIGRDLFGHREGLTAAAILAVLPLAVGWSRLAYGTIFLTFSYAFIVYLFFRTRDWRITYRLPFMALMAGIPFAAKYTGIFAAPFLAFLWILYEKPLLYDFSMEKDWFTNEYLSRFADFVILSGIFTVGAYVTLLITFPYLWRAPVGNFFHIFLKQSSRGGTGLFGIFQSISQAVVYPIVRNPLLVMVLAAIGGYLTVQKPTKSRLSLLAWWVAPSLIVVFGLSATKYVVPVIVPITLFAAVGLSALYNKYNDKLPVSKYSTLLLILVAYVAVSTVLVYPYPAGGYYSETVGSTSGAWKLLNTHDGTKIYLRTPGGYGAGVGEGMHYISDNAPTGATVQIYTNLQPFYMGVDRSKQYINPTDPPQADYVLMNQNYHLANSNPESGTTKPGWWFMITDQTGTPQHQQDYILTFDDMENNPNYTLAWQDGVMDIPFTRVYRRVR